MLFLSSQKKKYLAILIFLSVTSLYFFAPFCYKILESVISTYWLQFPFQHSLLSLPRSILRPHQCTETAFIKVTEDLCSVRSILIEAGPEAAPTQLTMPSLLCLFCTWLSGHHCFLISRLPYRPHLRLLPWSLFLTSAHEWQKVTGLSPWASLPLPALISCGLQSHGFNIYIVMAFKFLYSFQNSPIN